MAVPVAEKVSAAAGLASDFPKTDLSSDCDFSDTT